MLGATAPRPLPPQATMALCSIICCAGHREFARWGRLIAGDIRDSATLDAIFATDRYDVVMHFAALAYVNRISESAGPLL